MLVGSEHISSVSATQNEIMQIRKYIDTCMLIFQGFYKRLHLLWHKFTVESIRSDIRNTFFVWTKKYIMIIL